MTPQSQIAPNYLPIFENQQNIYIYMYVLWAFYPAPDLSISDDSGFKYILIILIFLLL